MNAYIVAVIKGEFGVVYQAKLRRNFVNDVVAVKTLKGKSFLAASERIVALLLLGFVVESNVEDLRKECAKMSEFDHPNVLTLIGMCLDGGPIYYNALHGEWFIAVISQEGEGEFSARAWHR